MAKGIRRGCSGCVVIFICMALAYMSGTGSPRSANRPATQNSTPSEQESTDESATIIAGDGVTPGLSPRPSATRTPVIVPVTSAPPQTYYTTANANGRECARTTCTRVMTLAVGTAVSVVGTTQGEAVSGTTTWMKLVFNGREMFIHGSLLSTSRPQARPTSRPVQQQSVSTPIPPPPAQNWNCSGDIYNCSSLTCSEIRSYTAACPGDPSRLDGDNDGLYCESDC